MREDERVDAVVTKTAVLESRLDGHEDICAKRYGDIAASFNRVQEQLEALNTTMTTGVRGFLIAVVVVMGSAFVTVLYNGWPWEKRAEQVHE